MANIKSQKVETALTRGVVKVYPSREKLEAILSSGKKIKIYNGIDPTGKLHIGHLVVLRKLRQFQDLGHEIIILIGGFTATIGDPTGKSAARKPLSEEQVLVNAKSYKKQIAKFLDLKKQNVKFLNNSNWVKKLTPKNLLKIASYFTVARLLERDMFQERIKKRKDIHLHEFLYPVFQAYDSVFMDVDMEIGGNDQMFNMMRGRDLMKNMKNKEKFVMPLKLLVDPSGKKMGKTEGNMINLEESANQIFGKIMSWPDSLVELGFELLTDVPLNKIKKHLKNLRQAKVCLAKEVAASCHSKRAAQKAEKEFNKVFKEKNIPSKVPLIEIKQKSVKILDLLVKAGLASSKSEAKRLILQKGVKINKKIEDDWAREVKTKKGLIIQVGKRKFVKLA